MTKRDLNILMNILRQINVSLLLIVGIMFVPGVSCSFAGIAEGIEAYEKGEYGRAIEEWIPAAEAGDRNALFNLGQMYRMGRGVEKDIGQAEYYYLKAAKLGHSAAQGNLGTLYYFGKAGKPQVQDAISWWRLAAHNGDPRSQYMLGVLHFNGKNVEKNLVDAYAWIWLARNSKLPEAVRAEQKIAEFLTPEEIEAAKRLSMSLIAGKPPAEVAMLEDTSASSSQQAPEGDDAPSYEMEEKAEDAGGTPVQANYRIQLGSYRDPDVATQSWKGLQKKHMGLLNGVDEVITAVDLGDRGTFYRLQVGAYEGREEAADMCDVMKSEGIDCLPVDASR